MLISSRPPSCLAAAMLALCALAAPGQAVSATGAAPQVEAPGAPNNPLLAQYRDVSRQTAALTIYNRHLQDLLASQAQEKTSLEQQLKDIEVTKQEIVPLILHMLDSLEQFVRMDLPFLPEERQQRLAQLKALVVRPDSTEAEKFRRLMEAFQVENEYGNTIEAYKGNIVLNGTTSSVNFLRLGRVALYYQRLDGSETGFWNKEEKRWQTLPADYRNAIRDGLRIARKEAAPDLLTLPVPAPEAAR
jgi:hypothetical protein